jgi:hypothetical protein
MAIAYSIERKIEDVILGLFNADTEVKEAVTAYNLTTKSAWQLDQKVKALGVVVHVSNLANANLAATGGGAYWTAVLSLECELALAANKSGEYAKRVHGICQRYLAALSAATVNSALTTAGAGITIHGITGTDQPGDDIDTERQSIITTSAVMLHFSVS